MYRVPVVASGTRYINGTSLLAYNEQETRDQTRARQRVTAMLSYVLLSGQGLGANSRTNRA